MAAACNAAAWHRCRRRMSYSTRNRPRSSCTRSKSSCSAIPKTFPSAAKYSRPSHLRPARYRHAPIAEIEVRPLRAPAPGFHRPRTGVAERTAVHAAKSGRTARAARCLRTDSARGLDAARLSAERRRGDAALRLRHATRRARRQFYLYLSRFLHLVVDLSLTPPDSTPEYADEFGTVRQFEYALPPTQGPVRFRIREDRIFKSDEIRYFDHPKFGVIAKVQRVAAAQDHAALRPPLVGQAQQ